MILKNYQTSKFDFKNKKILLFYGDNEGHKSEIIKNFTQNYKDKIIYEESEVIDKSQNFIEGLLTESLFEEEKIIIIKRVTDKIFKLIEEIDSKNMSKVLIILNAGQLEKRSKLRSFFEKSKNYPCVAFYPDNEQTISKLTYNFLREKKISISPSNINFIVNKCDGDRENLKNQLEKLESFSKGGKKITTDCISQLINVGNDFDVVELVNNCLVKNKKKILHILNENQFSNEDCIIITRTFLNKSKRILILSKEYEISKNIDQTISSAKPPIFWKDKEITKQQIYKWPPKDLKKLIYGLNNLELLVKTNVNNSINLVIDFLLDQSSTKLNN